MSIEHNVYAAFDAFPAPKGAAVHIDAFARGLADAFGPLDLVTVAALEVIAVSPGAFASVATPRPRDGFTHHPLPACGSNLIERVLHFRAHLDHWWRGRFAPVVQIRSPFEGYPIARRKASYCDRLVFEVNGLPSIELKYHHPAVADDDELLAKLFAMEQSCLDAADLVLTVCEVTADHLSRRGVDRARIRVIPNGVDLDLFPEPPPPPPLGATFRLLYSGTMSSWQGVRVAIEAVALCRRDFDATLALAGPWRPRQRQALLALASDLGVADSVRWLGPLPRAALAALHREADAVLAPLIPCDRNLDQGCSPLKVLEAMAAGAPLIASDLPVVREVVEPEVDALLVRPGSAKAIKEAVARLRERPGLGPLLAANARASVARRWTWDRAREQLALAYEEVLGSKRSRTLPSASRSAAG